MKAEGTVQKVFAQSPETWELLQNYAATCHKTLINNSQLSAAPQNLRNYWLPAQGESFILTGYTCSSSKNEQMSMKRGAK